ncbi:hypothetical protein GJ744_003535 [Endocarpon pusillum]|uniref:Uncharacterized protein n=1 Tax=Endocarpon pusillum TaxID=364733 RepID=A0A8H7AQQ3_9EURO|nr:hypothetical protein GJ744_003535 [Endocarpon pusillum]
MTQHRANEDGIVSEEACGVRMLGLSQAYIMSDVPVVTVFQVRTPKYDSNNPCRRASPFMDVVRAIFVPLCSLLLKGFDVSIAIQRDGTLNST